MPATPHLDLSRRERQIMLAVYEHGPSTAQDVLERLPDAPSYSAVRTLLRILVDKGHLSYHEDGPRYVYRAVTPREQASQGALDQVVQTFFDGSATSAVAALLSREGLDDATLDDLQALIDQARRDGR